MDSLDNKAAVYSVVCFFLLSVVAGIVGFAILSHKPADNGTVVTADTTYIPFTDTVYIPTPKLVFIEAPQLPPVIDSAAVVASYYSTRVYRDTLINLPELQVSVTDSVRENSLIGRQVAYNYVMPVITKTVTLPPPRWSGSVLVDSRGSVSALLRNNRTIYVGGYDIPNRVPFVGVGFNIFSR